MNKIIIIIGLAFLLCNPFLCKSQERDSLWVKFTHSDFFKNVIIPKIETNIDKVYYLSQKDTLISDICFKNIITKDKYNLRNIGIWKVGINSSEPTYYLLFKFGNKYYFERMNMDLILKRFISFAAKANLSNEEKVIALHEIVNFLNETYNFTCP